MQTAMSNAPMPFPTAYNFGMTARSTRPTSFNMDIVNFPIIYTCSPMSHHQPHQPHQPHHRHRHQQSQNALLLDTDHHHHHHRSASCSSCNSNSATDTSSVGSRSPDLPTPTMSPCHVSSSTSVGPTYNRYGPDTPTTSVSTSNHRSHMQMQLSQQSHLVTTTTAVTSPNNHQRPIRPFTIEAILGLTDRNQCSAPTVDLSLDVLVASRSSTEQEVLPNDTNRSPIVGCKRKQPMTKNVQKKSSCPSDKEFRINSKCKRVRTIFTPEQLEKLENEFERQQYMVGPERIYLAASLNLTEAQVKVWFQNRRIKWRKQHLEIQQAKLAKIRNENDNEFIDSDQIAEQLLDNENDHEDDIYSDDDVDEDEIL